jgi:type I restriction enzyme, S subunit
MMSADPGATRTGGRKATTRFVPGDAALSVGYSKSLKTPAGWKWMALGDVARMESGHTPSRKHPEYWDGDIPWIGIRDAKAHHGETITATEQCVTEIGIENSSARILPAGTVCLSRTASIGYVVVMGRPMATSQDFVNWVCSDAILPDFLKYLFLAQRRSFRRFASGATHQTIYYPELKAFHVCLPSLAEQQQIVGILNEAFAGIDAAIANTKRSRRGATEVLDSYLDAVFRTPGVDWTEREVGQIADHSLGKMLDKQKNRGDFRPYLRNLNVRWFDFDLDDILEMRFETTDIDRYTVRKGDVVICEGGYPGRAAIWDQDEPIYFQKALHRVRFHEAVYSRWFLYFLYILDRTGELRHHFTGAGIQHFTGRALSRFRVPIPPPSDAERHVRDFKQLHVEVRRWERMLDLKLSRLLQLQQSILQKAFAGELTAKSVEEATAVA